MQTQSIASASTAEDYLARLNLEGTRKVWQLNHPKIDYVLRKVRPRLKNGMKVAEFGVGDAYLPTHLGREICYTGLDLSSYLAEHHARHSLGVARNARFLQMDIADPQGYGLAEQDVVFCLDVLEHVNERQYRVAIHNIQRLLRPGGLFVGTVPYRENLDLQMVRCPDCGCEFHRIGHKQSFDMAKLKGTLQPEFAIVELGIVPPVPGRFRSCRAIIRWARYHLMGFRPGDTCYFVARRR